MERLELVKAYARGYDDGAQDTLRLLGEKGIIPVDVAQQLVESYQRQIDDEPPT